MILVKHFAAAFRFLTIIPLPGRLGTDEDDLKGALPYFSLVGIVLGLLAGAAAWFLYSSFPPLVAAVFLTLILLSFSGALHLDGLADSADGFFSSRKRELILEIMRDSRIGVMGVVALVMLLLLKVSALAQLDPKNAVQAAILMPIAGRSALVLMMFLLPYVRPEGGMGTIFYPQRKGLVLLLTLVLFSGSCVVILGTYGMVAVMVVLLTVFLFSRLCHKKIGGATGDTIGASCEIVETLIPFCLSSFFFQ